LFFIWKYIKIIFVFYLIIIILSITNYIFRGRYAISFAARILGYRWWFKIGPLRRNSNELCIQIYNPCGPRLDLWPSSCKRKGRTNMVSKQFNDSTELPGYLWKDKRDCNISKKGVTLKLKIGKLEELKFSHLFQETWYSRIKANN